MPTAEELIGMKGIERAMYIKTFYANHLAKSTLTMNTLLEKYIRSK